MVRFSSETDRILRQAGWHPGRCIEINNAITEYESAGYDISPTIKAFLSEFGDLKLQDDTTLLETHFDLVDWGEPEIRPISKHLNISLCAVGITQVGWLLVGSDDKFYHTDAGSAFYLIGNTADEAVENLVQRKHKELLIDEDTMRKIVPPYV